MPVFDDGKGFQLGAAEGSTLAEALRNDGWSEVEDSAPEAATEKPADPFKGLSRGDLNAKAVELGIADAEALPNRQAVVDAILAKEAENA